jgi:hypothetical protein
MMQNLVKILTTKRRLLLLGLLTKERVLLLLWLLLLLLPKGARAKCVTSSEHDYQPKLWIRDWSILLEKKIRAKVHS